MPEKIQCIIQPEQASVLREICDGIENKLIDGDDLTKVFTLHLSLLEDEKVSIDDIGSYNTRKWILSNLLRVMEDEYINPGCSPVVQLMLEEYKWVIDLLVKLHEIIQMDKGTRRTFIRMISRIIRDIMRAEIFIGNKSSSEVDLIQVIQLLDETSSSEWQNLNILC
jgi:hypothetical protein